MKKSVQVATTLVALAALVAPLVVYVSTFGIHLSPSHGRWAEFGALLAGIYSPVAAFLALLVLARQVASQNHFNKHQIDYSYLQNARADLHFYLDTLHNALSKHEVSANVPLSSVLVSLFAKRNKSQLLAPLHPADLERIKNADDRLWGLWGAVYNVLRGVKAVDHYQYTLFYSSTKEKCIALFGYAVCDALDNYHFAVTQGRVEVSYEFSLSLSGA
jgi:hypothetical protein